MSIKKDKYFISLANNLAKNNNGFTGANPSVGAIVVKNSKVISFGLTGFSGRPHAEINSLKKIVKKRTEKLFNLYFFRTMYTLWKNTSLRK